MPKGELSLQDLAMDFAAGGVSGAVSKTITAPIERVKLIIQTQDANPKIISGEVPRYTGIMNCFSRVASEQGVGAFWRGNFTNCVRYFPTQAFNLAFKDSIKKMFPKYNPKTEFWPFFGVNLASGGLAGAGSLCIVYPLDYARTRLASDVGSGKKTFEGLGDCLVKTANGPQGVRSLYNGFGISVAGIIPYRGVQFGLNDTLNGINPFAKEVSFVGIASKWACAQFSVIMSGFVTYPFDTVRRRLQMESEKPIEGRLYKGAGHCFSKVIKDEGVPALFKGAGANVLRGTGAALVLVLYGEASNYMHK
jgi:solute carrier family 25 (adenine nucleotide translocator) protein 4/5/6/31